MVQLFDELTSHAPFLEEKGMVGVTRRGLDWIIRLEGGGGKNLEWKKKKKEKRVQNETDE